MTLRTIVAALVLFHLLGVGLGSFVLHQRFPGLEAASQDLELVLILLACIALLYENRKKAPLQFSLHHWAALAFVCLLVVHLLLAPDGRRGAALTGLFVTGTPFIAFALALWVLHLVSDDRAVLEGFPVIVAIVALPALMEWWMGLSSMPLWVDARVDVPLSRSTGFLANPIVLAGCLQLLCSWLAIALLRGRRVSGLGTWLAALIVSIVAAWAIFVSFTRASWGAVAVACIGSWLLTGRRRHLVLVPLITLLVLIAVFPAGRGRAITLTSTQHHSNVTRVERWMRCISLWSEAPLFGHGLGRYCGIAANNSKQVDAFYAHNYMLHLAVELGLFGVLIYGIFWGGLVWAVLWRGPPHDLVGRAVIAGFAGFWLHAMFVGHMEYRPVAMLVGIGLALADRASRVSKSSPSSPAVATHRGRVIILWAPAVLALFGLLWVQVEIDSFQWHVEQALVDQHAGRAEIAKERLEGLILDDRNWLEPERQLARVILSRCEAGK